MLFEGSASVLSENYVEAICSFVREKALCFAPFVKIHDHSRTSIAPSCLSSVINGKVLPTLITTQ